MVASSGCEWHRAESTWPAVNRWMERAGCTIELQVVDTSCVKRGPPDTTIDVSDPEEAIYRLGET